MYFRSRPAVVIPILLLVACGVPSGEFKGGKDSSPQEPASRVGEGGSPPLRAAALVSAAEASGPFAEALELQAMGDFDEAVAVLERLVAEHDGHGDAHRRLAALLDLLGRDAEAQHHRARALALGEDVAVRSAPQARPAKAATSPIVAPALRVDSGGRHWSSEPTIAIGPEDGQLIAGWIDTRRSGARSLLRMAMAQSFDRGQSWEDFIIDTPAVLRREAEGDPLIAVDPERGDVWASGLAVAGGIFVVHRPPGSQVFEDPVATYVDGGPGVVSDKPMIAFGPDPLEPSSKRLYVMHNIGLQVSTDQGATWTDPEPVVENIGAHPVIGPQGELYLIYWDNFDGIWLRCSFDGGRSFSDPIRVVVRRDFWNRFNQGRSRFPGEFKIVLFPVAAADPRDGKLYCLYMDTTSDVDGQADIDLYLTYSTDRGSTWSVPRIINRDSDPPADQFLPWLTVDPTGRLHTVFYDTRENPQQDSNSGDALLDAFYAFSEDGGETWSEIRLTPDSFAASLSWLPNVQFVSDYIGLAADARYAYPIYMSAASGDSDILINVIDFGEPPVPPVGPCVADGESVCLQGSRFRVSAEWEGPDGQRGVARPELLTADTGYFWFFSAGNVELVVKVLDGCDLNGHFWVFGAGLTNVGVRLEVEDAEAGAVRVYENRLGDPLRPVLDNTAFTTCDP